MKTQVMIFAMSLLTQLSWANDKYEQAMLKNIEAVYDAETPESIQQAVNTFERIGGAEKDKWEPFYYASFGYIMMSVREQDATKKDGLLDKAQEILKKASAINAQESEIVALEGFIYMMKVAVDPASRGQQYSGLAMQTFGKALGMNPENPRALALMAQMELGTAQFFKSPIDKACATANGALEKFDSFQSDNPLAPRWGRHNAMMVVNQCK